MVPVSKRNLMSAALALACLAAAGCAGPRVNAWPLLFRETRVVDGRPVTRVDLIGPLFSIENGPDRLYHVLRPLYNYERNKVDGASRTQFLWPLGLSRNRPGEQTLARFLPLFQHVTTQRKETGEKTTHGMVIPLAFWGNVAGLGPYFAVFPLGGTTHRLFGDTCNFVVFPLYCYYRFGDYERYNVLWPIVSWGRTPDGRRKSLRVWPFYTCITQQQPGGPSFKHVHVMWPLVRWGMQSWGPSDDRQTRRYVSVWPFFMDQTVRAADGDMLARQRSYLLFSTTYDAREGKKDTGWSALLGLFGSRKSDELDELKIFPVYWQTTHYRDGRDSGRKWTRRRAPWPLVWLDKSTLEPGRKVSNFVVAPLYWDMTKYGEDEEGRDQKQRSISVWPLVTVRHSSDGSRDLWVPAHAWPDTGEGWKRNLRGLLELFEHHRSRDGESETRLIWRLFEHRSGPKGRYISVAGMVTYDSIGDDGAGGCKSWSALFGLVKRSRWDDGSRRWRVCYIPLGREQRGPQ